jgi:hypothetical protein
VSTNELQKPAESLDGPATSVSAGYSEFFMRGQCVLMTQTGHVRDTIQSIVVASWIELTTLDKPSITRFF